MGGWDGAGGGGVVFFFLGRGMAVSDWLSDPHAWGVKGRVAGLGLALGGGGCSALGLGHGACSALGSAAACYSRSHSSNPTHPPPPSLSVLRPLDYLSNAPETSTA